MYQAYFLLRRRLLVSVLMAGIALCICCGKPAPMAGDAAAERPNILLIMADDLGYETLSCNGSASYSTPVLDGLAAEGARFLNCHVQPLCTPTRAQLMTGRYNFRNYRQFGTLIPGERTFGHMLKEQGYATGVFGKWQLDAAGGQTPKDAGFDQYCLWNYAEAKGDRYPDPQLAFLDDSTPQETTRIFKGEYGPDICARQLLGFVERSVQRKVPFFAYYPMILTHNPFMPTPDSPEWQTDPHAVDDRFFKDMVEYMDKIVGRIVTRLDQLGVRENTWIIFTGDNGTNTSIESRLVGHRVLRGAKGYHTDAGTHVPLIVNRKGIVAPGQVREELVDSTDFLPTLAEATGSPLPQPPGDGILDGLSFLPFVRGEPGRQREWIYVGYTEERQTRIGRPRARLLRDRRYKLYQFYEQVEGKSGKTIDMRTGHLYDLLNDPEEEHPILEAQDSPETAAVRAKFRELLAQLGRDGSTPH